MSNAEQIIEHEPEQAQAQPKPRGRQAVARMETAPPSLPAQGRSPMDLVAIALERGASVEVIDKMFEWQERADKYQARKAFDAAMADAKAEIPVISKNREVDFTSQKGRTNYRYEDLAEIVRVITPVLAKHGLYHRFKTTAVPNEPVTVTCVLAHRDGHFEETTLSGPRDESGNKNGHQAVGSAATYLQRIALKSMLGLASSIDDDDAHGVSGGPSVITAEQVQGLTALIEDSKANVPLFKQHFRISELSDLPATRFDEAMQMLQQKMAARK